jgi:hypothetical protein
MIRKWSSNVEKTHVFNAHNPSMIFHQQVHNVKLHFLYNFILVIL